MIIPNELTPDISELLGIIVGDGYIRTKIPRWLSIECSASERSYIDCNVIPLIKSIFDIDTRGKYFNRRGNKNTYGINVCNTKLVAFLEKCEVAVRHNVINVPKTVLLNENKNIKYRFLRGYIDTDGCLSFIKKSDKFRYPRLNVSSVSMDLIKNVSKMFEELGFSGSLWTMKLGKKSKLPLHRFEIKGEKMIHKWFTEIGTGNPSILSKYLTWSKTGECKTNSTFEERIRLLKTEGISISADMLL